MTHTCALPGCENPVKSSKNKFCSHPCWAAFYTKPRGKCQNCGAPLEYGEKYACSRKCSNALGNHSQNVYTAEVKQRIAELWLAGELSAAAIGQQVGGLTKNMIIGIVRRAGLPKRHSPIRPLEPAVRAEMVAKRNAANDARLAEVRRVRAMTDVDVERRRQEPRPKAEPKPAPILPAPVVVYSHFKTCQYVEEGARHRQWIYCDNPAEPGVSYCLSHSAICYIKRKKAA